MGLDAIDLGEDFVEAIETTVGRCDVLIAVIGNNWLNTKDERGSRRLDNPEDFVRMEIATALKRKIRVIPVLVDGAVMPSSTDLPDDLKLIVRRNALRITGTSFDGDCQRLAATIRLVLQKAAVEERQLLEAEQREKERLEAEQREKERLEAGQREKRRLEVERRENERLQAERLEKERLDAEQQEKQRLEAEQRQREKEGLLNERREKGRLEAERLEAERRRRLEVLGLASQDRERSSLEKQQLKEKKRGEPSAEKAPSNAEVISRWISKYPFLYPGLGFRPGVIAHGHSAGGTRLRIVRRTGQISCQFSVKEEKTFHPFPGGAWSRSPLITHL
jgi:hypothetical protein